MAARDLLDPFCMIRFLFLRSHILLHLLLSRQLLLCRGHSCLCPQQRSTLGPGRTILPLKAPEQIAPQFPAALSASSFSIRVILACLLRLLNVLDRDREVHKSPFCLVLVVSVRAR